MKTLTPVYGAQVYVLHVNAPVARTIEISAPFDCIIINSQVDWRVQEFGKFATSLVSQQVSWIEVFGFHAEKLHDCVDAASVAIGRQEKSGDGSPMTTWKECGTIGLGELQEIADYIKTGGQGDTDTKLLVIFGTDTFANDLIQKIECRE